MTHTKTLDRAETLKREQPLRSARSIIRILSLDTTNPIPEPLIAPRTLRRQLARRGATAAQLLAEQRLKPYRRFERSHFGDLWQGDAMHGLFFSFHNNRYRVPAYLRIQTVQLRYDPFDLTRIEVWFNDAFLQLAEPDQIVTTVHPDVTPDPIPVSAPDSGLDYLALLRQERQRLIQQQLDSIHFSQLEPKEHDDHSP